MGALFLTLSFLTVSSTYADTKDTSRPTVLVCISVLCGVCLIVRGAYNILLVCMSVYGSSE